MLAAEEQATPHLLSPPVNYERIRRPFVELQNCDYCVVKVCKLISGGRSSPDGVEEMLKVELES